MKFHNEEVHFPEYTYGVDYAYGPNWEDAKGTGRTPWVIGYYDVATGEFNASYFAEDLKAAQERCMSFNNMGKIENFIRCYTFRPTVDTDPDASQIDVWEVGYYDSSGDWTTVGACTDYYRAVYRSTLYTKRQPILESDNHPQEVSEMATYSSQIEQHLTPVNPEYNPDHYLDHYMPEPVLKKAPVRKKKHMGLRESIIDYFFSKPNEVVTLTELCEAVGESPKYVQMCISKMRRQGIGPALNVVTRGNSWICHIKAVDPDQTADTEVLSKPASDTLVLTLHVYGSKTDSEGSTRHLALDHSTNRLYLVSEMGF